ncbi:unnamed protein product [Leptosia nina]|uniref:Uncharacterized protein n=1 Tax=Leptosia nina TaxID=320188 RepID=A0AAV1JV60_9NEOP
MYYDRNCKSLPALNVGDPVIICDNNNSRCRGTVIGRANTPRSYIIENKFGSRYRRNRRHLKQIVKPDPLLSKNEDHHDQNNLISEPDGDDSSPDEVERTSKERSIILTRSRAKKLKYATLDLGDQAIKTALLKKTETGFIEEDKRGKHKNHPKVDLAVKESVVQFIHSIPRIESHYLRAQTTREYILSERSLADIYRDYKDLRQATYHLLLNQHFSGYSTSTLTSDFLVQKKICVICVRVIKMQMPKKK